MPDIPDHWSPSQALAVFDFVCDLQQQIWDRYERVLVDLIIADLHHDADNHHIIEDLEDPEHDIPF